MAHSAAQLQFREDSAVLAKIGRHLARQLDPVTVRLPAILADQAAAAWSRHDEGPAGPETLEEAVLHSFASTLAFVGLAVGEDRRNDVEDVTVTLRPQDIAGCLFAAEHAGVRLTDAAFDRQSQLPIKPSAETSHGTSDSR